MNEIEKMKRYIERTCEAISFPVPPALNRQIQGQLDLFGRPGLEEVRS